MPIRSLLRDIAGQPAPSEQSLGLGRPPGDFHYRAYVGPPEDYDVIAASTFNLLTQAGLRQHHQLLDVGCGSLRVGRLLIPYLNAGNYCGIEPNRWLVEAGIRHETGTEQLAIKRPRFHFDVHARALPAGDRFDFALAQSIFSHCGIDLIRCWLGDIAERLHDTGALLATFMVDEQPCPQMGWVYPECIGHPVDTVAGLARDAGLTMHLLDWPHPRQQWAAFAKPGFVLPPPRQVLSRIE